MGENIIITEGGILEIKAMKETRVGHMIGKTEVITEGTIEASVIVGQGQVQDQVQNRNRVRCFECREYDHFTRDCPTTQVHREVEQI